MSQKDINKFEFVLKNNGIKYSDFMTFMSQFPKYAELLAAWDCLSIEERIQVGKAHKDKNATLFENDYKKELN